ncbi:MAG TPA: YlbF family regulator [Clostridia bacterium]|mgnify:CR=1 FL=1|jgi:cell fate (sporulation/competence/biofilm development) regulator YlbF (YheA/YmcA/DUF963 family)|nr:YlbF family regulator [Clostridia bacterium]HHY05669.1 YlbF family regulator [Clostridia bacterium]
MIYDQAHKLARAIRASSEYRDLKAAQKQLEKNEESQKVLHDFQAKQFEIQTLQMLGQEVSLEKKEEFEKMSEVLQFHPTVQDYLQAEYRMIKIMGDIQKIITDALGLDRFEVEE